ncbi:hypothetical protein STURON_00936 [Spiroplasma turonicum]|uniref:Uncharacterized protein n=1 Tax=Spiroplasma turonicum TaxID=216946 RepID=A0A0K1P8F5_9MOLU|nr:hypothetical protein STURON_00936 [Spiroplasma turonicum]
MSNDSILINYNKPGQVELLWCKQYNLIKKITSMIFLLFKSKNHFFIKLIQQKFKYFF